MGKQLEYATLLEEEGLTVEELPIEIRKRINVLRPLIAKFNNKPSDNLKAAIIKADVEVAEMIADYIEKDLPEKNEGNEDDDDNNSGKSSKNRNRNNNSDDDDDESNADGNGDNRNANNKNRKGISDSEREAIEKAAIAKAEKAAADKKAADEKAEADKKAADEKAAADKKAAEEAAAEEEQRKKDASKKKITDFGTLEMEKKITENCEKNNGFISEKDLISIIGKSPDYPQQKVYSIALKKVFLKPLYQLL